jgi:uncharacterized protein YcgI (DUF1989 family)
VTSYDLSQLLEDSPHLCPTPLDRDFYEGIAERLGEAQVLGVVELADLTGRSLDVAAGSTLSIELLEGPQIVNLFVFNHEDPDERMWQQHTILKEGVFFDRFARVWGTMARHRPLATVVENTVSVDVRWPTARYHPYFGGTGTPADWRAAGGTEGVPSTWEQFAALLDERGVPRHILGDNLCLFQRSVIDPGPMRVEIVPSEAVAGDRVTLFAEIDLCVLVVLSPYVDGSRPASELGHPTPRAVRLTTTEKLADPLPWPYPGVRYPDLSLYVDERGIRTNDVAPTPGINYEVRSSES